LLVDWTFSVSGLVKWNCSRWLKMLEMVLKGLKISRECDGIGDFRQMIAD